MRDESRSDLISHRPSVSQASATSVAAVTDHLAADDGPSIARTAVARQHRRAGDAGGRRSATRAADPPRLGADRPTALELFDAQLLSRHLDHAARWLRGRGLGFYTIGSAGHEGNAAVAAALRPTDPALLHYRSGGFYLARARQVADHPMRGPRRAGGHAGLGRRADRRRPPQGVRPSATSTSSRRPRRSPRTCRARWVWPSRSDRARRLGPADARGRSTRWRCARSATPAPTTPQRRARSTPPSTRRTPAWPCRCCSCARTTAGASACRHRRGWIEHSFGDIGRASLLAGRRQRSGRDLRRGQRTRRRGSAPIADRRSCTCAPCASWATPAPTSSRAIARRRRSVPTSARSDCWARRACWSTPGCGRPPSCATQVLVDAAPRGRERCAESMLGRADAARRRRGDGTVVAATSGAGRAVIGARCAEADRRRVLRRHAARGRGTTDAGRDDQPHAGRVLLRGSSDALVFGEDVGAKGGVYGVTRGLQKKAGHGAGVRQLARRAVDPRDLALGAGGVGAAADPRDPVPRVPAQRRGSAAWRGGQPVVLLEGRVHATRWWFASPGWPTRRASAATSTTTTPSPCCATSPVW